MRRVRLLLFALGALGAQRSALAQWQYSLDAGASHLRQAGIPESNALLLGATLDGATRATYFRSSFLTAGSDGDGNWTGTGQGIAIGGVVDPAPHRVRWEISGATSAFSQSGTRPTTTGELAAGLQTGSQFLGASLGAGGGFSAHARDVTPARRASATGWWGTAAEHFDARLDLTHTREQLFLAPSIPVTYVDGIASWRHDHGGVTLGATGGYRAVSTGNVAKGAWLSGDAMFWVAQHTALVVSAGRTPADAVRGFPVATYASITLRFASERHATIDHAPTWAPRVTASRSAEGGVVFEVRAPTAKSIEIAADFTAWTPVSLSRVGDVWRLERAVPAGPHRMTVRIDGGEWITPANLPRVEDEFAGAAAVITIP